MPQLYTRFDQPVGANQCVRPLNRANTQVSLCDQRR
jgi:hypothetical protein